MNPNNAVTLFCGRFISTMGDSIYQIAVIWYVFELTKDVFYTGLAAAITMFPKAFGFLFGPWIEQANQKKILVRSQFIQFSVLIFIPILMFFHYENVFLILFVMFCISLIENIEGTAEVSIVPRIIESQYLGRYNSLINGSEQLIGIFTTGLFSLIITYVGIRNIYLFNAFSFLLASFFFLRIKYQHQEKSQQKESFDWKVYQKELKNGFIYFFTSKLALICLPFLIANGISGITMAILPAYAEYKMNAADYGLLVMSITIGSLLGTLLAMKCMKYPLGLMMIILPFTSFFLWITSLWMNDRILTCLVLGMAFVPFGVMKILFITHLQLSIDEEMISRVVSILDSILVSTMPLGSLFAALLTPVVGVANMMIISSLGLLSISLFFAFNSQSRTLPSVMEK